VSRKDPMQMADIARIAGVSKSTVSRALADSSLVNEKTKSLIRDIAQQHGYRVNIAARNFRLKESLTVALLIPQADGVDWTISDAFFLEMTAAIAEALDERGHALLLTRATPQSGEWIEEFVRRRQADGIILIGQGSQHELIQQISETFQGISVWGEAIAGANYPTVGTDNLLGGERATEQLIRRGCQRIAFVGYEPAPEIDARFKGYLRALEAAGHSYQEKRVFGAVVGSDSASMVLERIIDQREQLDGFFAASDQQAVALMTALQQNGVNVPGQCAVVGYDDLPIARWYHPALTTVHQSRTLGAQILVDNLLAAIEGRDTSNVKLDPQLVVRESA